MFTKTYQERLRSWVDQRKVIEESKTPLLDVIKLYADAPRTSIQVDPYDQSTWLSGWELIKENRYCSFALLLGMCYTLQLTNRFRNISMEIYVCTDKENCETVYYLKVGDWILLPDLDYPVRAKTLPKTLMVQEHYKLTDYSGATIHYHYTM